MSEGVNARIVAILFAITLPIGLIIMASTISRRNDTPAALTISQEQSPDEKINGSIDEDILPQAEASSPTSANGGSESNKLSSSSGNKQNANSSPAYQKSSLDGSGNSTDSTTQNNQASDAIRADWDLGEGYKYEIIAYEWHFISDACWESPAYWSLKERDFQYIGSPECYTERSVNIVGKGYTCSTYYSLQVRCSVISLLKDEKEVFSRQKTLNQLSEIVAPYKVSSLSVTGGGPWTFTEEVCKQYGLSCG